LLNLFQFTLLDGRGAAAAGNAALAGEIFWHAETFYCGGRMST
jgi:hypothetical protein